MAFHIDKIEIPKTSHIFSNVTKSYYSDCYCFQTKAQNRVALQIWLDHAAKMPAWINFLMASRNKIASAIGLKDLGHLGAGDVIKPVSAYRVGDKIGIFTLLFFTDNEIILGDSDKHLDVKVSVYKDHNDQNLISISTVVHVHNLLGRLYMLVVKPMHKMIVPAGIKRAEA